MRIKPLKASYLVENSASGIKVSIPTPRNWFVILFTSAWLGGWFFGFKSASGELLHSTAKTPDGFLSFWLIAWTIGGIAVASTILWQLFGSEVIEVSNGSLIRRILIAGLGMNREYDVSHIKSLRLSPMDAFSSRQASFLTFPFGKTAGPIAFDYGAKTIRFGGAIDEAETKQLIEELRPFLPKSLLA